MNKDIFFQYDFYTLEQRYSEIEFIHVLDQYPSLSDAVKPFTHSVAEQLHLSMKESKLINIKDVEFPIVEYNLESILHDYELYRRYKETNPNENLLKIVTNKFLHRLFEHDGHNDEEYTIQRYIHYWLEKELALHIITQDWFNSVKVLLSLAKQTELLHYFYPSLIDNISQEWIEINKEDLVNIKTNPENILDNIRTFDKEYLKNNINLLQPLEGQSLWQFTEEVTHAANYASLNEEFSFRSHLLLKNNVPLWVEFWDNLKFPVIQDCALHFFFNPDKYIEIIKELTAKDTTSDTSILLLIVIKKDFSASYKSTERLSFYGEKERMNEGNKYLFDEGKKCYKEWLTQKEKYYKEIFQNIQVKMDYAVIEDWIFSYKPITNRPHKSNEIFNEEIDLLKHVYKSIDFSSRELNFDFKSLNLQKFNYYVDIIKENEHEYITKITTLLDVLLKYITSNKFYWDRSFTEPYWSTLKGIGYILSKHIDVVVKSKELIDKFRVNHQGWKPSEINFKSSMEEVFIYSGIVMLFEYPDAFKSNFEKEDFFKYLSSAILIQSRYSLQMEYYEMPLRLLFLVANQIFADVKDCFEQELIMNYDDLYSLLSLISYDGITLSDKAKKMLNNRLENELLIEKRQLGIRKQRDKIEKLNKMIELLGF